MSQDLENQLYVKIATAFDRLELARKSFREYLDTVGPRAAADYYKDRNYLRDAEADFAEAVKEARRLVGAPSSYIVPDYEKWRSEFLSRFKILAESEEFASLKAEIEADPLIGSRLSREDIERLLTQHFEPQHTGKRKLANIKVRILLVRLTELVDEVRGMAQQAKEKFLSGG